MKAKLIPAVVILLALMMLIQAALASTCNFTFESGGATYRITHHVDSEGSWFKTENPMQDTSPHFDFDDYTPEYIAYLDAESAAKNAHLASCPYMGRDLGDDNAPLSLLCAGATLAAIAAVIVRRKRLGTA